MQKSASTTSEGGAQTGFRAEGLGVRVQGLGVGWFRVLGFRVLVF